MEGLSASVQIRITSMRRGIRICFEVRKSDPDPHLQHCRYGPGMYRTVLFDEKKLSKTCLRQYLPTVTILYR